MPDAQDDYEMATAAEETRPRGRLTGLDVLAASMADDAPPATPPAGADEVRAAIDTALRDLGGTDLDAETSAYWADVLMDRVVAPIIRERDQARELMSTDIAVTADRTVRAQQEADEQRERADYWEAYNARLSTALENQRDMRGRIEAELDDAHAWKDHHFQRAERAEAELRARERDGAEQFQVEVREAERVAGILAERDATIARVRELHSKVPTTHTPEFDGWCPTCESEWPCGTITALDGTDGGESRG